MESDHDILQLRALWLCFKRVAEFFAETLLCQEQVDDLTDMSNISFFYRLLQKCPIPFLENESMEAVMQLATAATVLNHREAHASTIKFLVDLIHCGGNDPVNVC